MRFTVVLYRQPINYFFKKNWKAQGKRVPIDMGTEKHLTDRGIKVINALEFVNPPPPVQPPPQPQDDPNYHDRPCYFFGDSNVLLEGTRQTQSLLKLLTIAELPTRIEEAIERTKLPASVEQSMQQAVMNACMFDAEQEKLIIRKDPERPAWVFPRDYGITDRRKNRLLAAKLIQHCERIAPLEVSRSRRIINDAFFAALFENAGSLIQLEVHAEAFLAAKQPIEAFSERQRFQGQEIPDIFPLKPTVSIPGRNIYVNREIYPIRSHVELSHPHTLLLHYSPLDVSNLYETPVTNSQFESRSILKAFAAAVARAKCLYGDDVKVLPEPIVIQTVQSDTKRFQFGVLELNTLDLEDTEGVKNYWYARPALNLYEECVYKDGKPVLKGYDKRVFRYMNVFYNN